MTKDYVEFSSDDAAQLDRLDRLAIQLDSLFTIPVLNLRVGIENIVSLIPVVGDILAVIPSLLIVHQSAKLGARPLTRLRMMGNILVDVGIGFVPLVGDLFDIAWNANLRNVALLRRDMIQRYAAAETMAPVAQS